MKILLLLLFTCIQLQVVASDTWSTSSNMRVTVKTQTDTELTYEPLKINYTKGSDTATLLLTDGKTTYSTSGTLVDATLFGKDNTDINFSSATINMPGTLEINEASSGSNTYTFTLNMSLNKTSIDNIQSKYDKNIKGKTKAYVLDCNNDTAIYTMDLYQDGSLTDYEFQITQDPNTYQNLIKICKRS